MSKHKFQRFKKIAPYVLNILSACLLVCAVMCSYLEHGLFNMEGYQEALLDEEFDACVIQEVTQALDNIGTVVEIPRETIVDAIGMDRMVTYAHDYTNNFMNTIFNGESEELEDFTSEPLYGVVEAELNSYAQRENLTVSPESVDEAYDYILQRINQTLHYIPAQIASEAQGVSQKAAGLRNFKGLEFPLYGIAVLPLLLSFLIAGRKKTKKVIFLAIRIFWCVFATVFFPFLLLSIYNVPSHIALSESTLFCLVAGTCRILITRPTVWLGLIMIVMTCALVYTCYRTAKDATNKTTVKPGFFRVDFSREYGKKHHHTDPGNGEAHHHEHEQAQESENTQESQKNS